MSGGYGVIYNDLATMAGKFHTESGNVQDLDADLAHKGVSTGDGELDTMLAAVLTTLQDLNKGIARKLGQHSNNLSLVQCGYRRSDADVARLLDKLCAAAKDGGKG